MPMQFSVARKDAPHATQIVDAVSLMATCETLSENGRHPLNVIPVVEASKPEGVKPVSTFESQVSDDAARVRIEAQHAALIAAGVQVNASEQLFATGTRMASSGYATQAARKLEHDRSMPLEQAAAELSDMVRGEGREDRTVSAKELGDSIHANGQISAFGFTIGEQAIRGLAGRIDSPMLGYVLGLRDRMVARKLAAGAHVGRAALAKSANESDRAKIAEVIRHECLNNQDAKIKLRTRAAGAHGRPDCYAIVSEGYSPADAPDAIDQLLRQLPRNARGSYAYDVASTTWELRASIWTPTPVAEQAVGEAFEGYVSFQSRDNGTSKFRGGGGVVLLRCLNASTYSAEGASVARVHRGRILYAVDRMLRGSLRAVDALAAAWGTNRETELTVPTVGANGRAPTLEEVIPGFYMSLLRGKGSELAGVLTGRTSTHVEGLSKAFFAERRDDTRLVRSDLAQGWTRYIQDQPADVRRDGEQAIGAWLVANRQVKCDLKTA